MNTGYVRESVDHNSLSEMRISRNRRRREAIFRRQIIVLALLGSFIIFMASFMLGTIMTDAQSDNYSPEFRYYKTVTVHSDETLWDIAELYFSPDNYRSMNQYITDICHINNLGDPDMIRSGEAIIIPYYSSEFK